MPHRTGCTDPTGHDATFGACARAGRIAVFHLESTGSDYGRARAFDRETERFWKADAEGLSPDAPTNEAVDRAYRKQEARDKLPDFVQDTIASIKGD